MKKLFIPILACFSVFTSCERAENYSNLEYEVLKVWDANFFSANVNPVNYRPDTGHITIHLTTDNRLQYQYKVDLFSGDSIVSLTLHPGDIYSSNPAVLDFKAKGSVGFGTGAAFNIRPTLRDSLLNPANKYYVQLNSVRLPNGAIRAQLNENIVFAANVPLSGNNEVPSVNTTATGNASIRITADKKLYSMVTVSNLEPTDALTAAHIHTGAPGVNGPVMVGLAASAADFGVQKIISLTDAQFQSITKRIDRLYVNVHTTAFPAGKIRGQLK